jgi:tRNA-binding EMAP/Myf-like protein
MRRDDRRTSFISNSAKTFSKQPISIITFRALHYSPITTTAMVDLSEYVVGVVLSVESSSKGNKMLKTCRINIGDEDNPITVVTNAPNVREQSR